MSRSKTLAVYMTVAAVAAALTACAKGFKAQVDTKTPVVGAGSANIAVPTTAVTYNPLLELAMDQSPEVEAIGKDPINQGKQITVDAKIGFAITQLDPSGVSSAKDSVLYLYITVKGSDGKQATALVTSNVAELSLTAPSEVHIDGYWTLARKNQVYPYYVGIQSTAKLVDHDLRLQGTLIANFTGGAVQTLATFDQPICTLVIDPMSWVPKFYEEGSFGGCALPSQQAETQDAFDP